VPPLRARRRHRRPSLTKYLGGHGNSLGGIIVDSGKFPWAEHKRASSASTSRTCPTTAWSTPKPSARPPTSAAPASCRCATWAPRSPFNAFLILQGIETLALRMDRICENTLKMARFLKDHPKCSWVNYAGLEDHKDHPLVQKYMGGRASGILNFGVKGGREGGGKFQDA
jgi:O-acetylhomoserine (thiol)-lyase